MSSKRQDTAGGGANASTVGWTKAEYDAAPDMATRLHAIVLRLEDRIIELEAENARLYAALHHIALVEPITPVNAKHACLEASVRLRSCVMVARRALDEASERTSA